jgi:hypothetical protein
VVGPDLLLTLGCYGNRYLFDACVVIVPIEKLSFGTFWELHGSQESPPCFRATELNRSSSALTYQVSPSYPVRERLLAADLAHLLAAEVAGLRLSTVLGVSHTTVLNWLRLRVKPSPRYCRRFRDLMTVVDSSAHNQVSATHLLSTLAVTMRSSQTPSKKQPKS